MRGVGRGPIAHYLGQYVGAPRLRELKVFQQERARALGQHEPVAQLVERARSLLRLVVAGREGSHRAECRQPNLAHGGFGATREHGFSLPAPDDLRGLANGVRRRRAGRHHRVVRAFDAHLDRDLPGSQVGQYHRNGERADLGGAFVAYGQDGLGQGLDAADA